MSCQHDDPGLHVDCSADCLIYDCGSAFACCNNDCHPDADEDERRFWLLFTYGILLAEKIKAGS